MSFRRFSDYEIIECKLKCSLSERGVWKNSSQLKLTENPAAGNFYISCSFNEFIGQEPGRPRNRITAPRNVNVKLVKTCPKPAMATIKLQLTDMNPHIRNINDWEEECEFNNLPFKHGTQTCSKSGTCSESDHTHDSHNYSIKIKCQIIWYGFYEELYSPHSVILFAQHSAKKKLNDMKIIVGRKYYPAHKIILTSQSLVLAMTLSMDLKEPEESCLDMTDLGSKVVKELLLFLYENRIDKAYDDDKLLLKLLKAADLYQICSLKNFCGMVLSNRLWEDYALMLLETGYVYKCSILQARAIAYIVEKRDEFLPQKEFKELTQRQPGLFLEFYSMMNFFTNS